MTRLTSPEHFRFHVSIARYETSLDEVLNGAALAGVVA
jgi:hypothetical protein